ncbi:class II fructose-bisphosphate aldolase [Olsenella sp. DNF00959]|uniref:class II fructose-bisphosphate aldolase n=1 Tax=Olsenella sp. DNF00959 TaxID=1476999 RepID=UPI0007807249|nr:class II fructose-bisphosphate aldolase [Olsenella sp. DNF00959]
MYVSMREMLRKANEGSYAVMAINAFNIESAHGIIQAAEAMRSPIIIDLLQDHLKSIVDCNLITNPIIRMAQDSPVPVALNLDHGSDVRHLKRCVHEGFSSVMVDASALPFEDNVRVTRDVVSFAEPYGASVEAEVGNMGLVGEGSGFTDADMYTEPEAAISFIKETGVDALAVSYGSTHGNYPEGYVPTFHFDIVERIKEATGCPLVLHGGSGAGAENIKRSLEVGINKINVGTDYMNAQREFVRQALAADPELDYPSLATRAAEAGGEVLKRYIELAGSANKA